jgi:hypothetical protein
MQGSIALPIIHWYPDLQQRVPEMVCSQVFGIHGQVLPGTPFLWSPKIRDAVLEPLSLVAVIVTCFKNPGSVHRAAVKDVRNGKTMDYQKNGIFRLIIPH